MKTAHSKKGQRILFGLAAIGAAVVATPLHGGQSNDQVTISLSGATFMRNFTTSAGISLLTPGEEMTLLSGASGAPVIYKAASGATTSVQLAPNNLGGTIDPNPTGGFPAGATASPVTSANYAGLRLEWHEQGSIEGVLELINDQVKPVVSVGLTNRNPSTGNPTWVNRNSFTTHPNTINGYTLNTSAFDAAYGGATFDDSNLARPGRNIQGGQNRVQMAISDVNASQGFAVGSSSNAAWYSRPSQDGYGKGNQALNLAAPGNIQGLGFAGVRHELNSGDVANMNAADINPNTGAAYGAGPWNSGGVDNLHNEVVANGGLTYVANPGTGLTRVNRTDAVWLHTTGRLANGADFNVATRDEFSGTVNTAVTNIGLDVSWSTGENDNGNGNGAGGGASQTRIGPDIKFSNKTSGSSQVRPTVQNSRMGFGHLTSSESVPESFNSRSRPLRVVEYRDDDNDLSDGSNNALPADRRNNTAFADPITGSDAALDIYNGFTRMTAKSLVEGSYVLRTNQTYVTVKDPKAAFAGLSATDWANLSDDIVAGTGIKGDNHNEISGTDYGNDVFDFRTNILEAVANFPASSVANPADELLAKGFILSAFVKKTKSIDGLNQDVANPDYDSGLSSSFLGSTYVTAFNTGDPRLVMQGTSGTYGNNQIGTGSATPVGGSIAITSDNWLFGDFDQTGAKKGIRDFSDLTVAQQAQAALFTSGLGTDWNVNAGSNATTVAGAGMTFTPTKGDLIVLGDYDSDGDFDGLDLYRFVRGAALADNTSSTTLTVASSVEFGDMIRKGVLRKNAALDQLASSATAQQKLDARASAVNDPAGANAFNKRDVTRDGLVNFVDAVTSDKFFGQDYRTLEDQLSATRDIRVGEVPTPISLVDAELTDSGNINQADLDVINAALGGTGAETWTGTMLKSGGGAVAMNYTGGTFKVNGAAALTIDAGTVNVGGSADPFTDNTGSATNGNHLAIVNNSVTTLNVTAGSKAVSTLSGAGKTTVSSGASLTADHIRQAELSIDGTATIRANGGGAGVSRVASLAITGKLDLNDNDLIVDGGDYSAIEIFVVQGFNGGDWLGTGITSSAAANDTVGVSALGIIDNAEFGYTEFSGQTGLNSDEILVKYTYYGDADVGGTVNNDDFVQFLAGYNEGAPAKWLNGDFDYNASVNLDDFALFLAGLQDQDDPRVSPELFANLAEFVAAEGVDMDLSAIPEPAGLSLLALGSLFRIARQRVQRVQNRI